MPHPTSASRTARPFGSAADWTRTASLWVARWLIVLAVNWLFELVGGEGGATVHLSGNMFILFLYVVVAAPLFETIVECLVPYTALSYLRKSAPGVAFVLTSAALMALLHLISAVAVLDAAITGAFIAYVYRAAAGGGQRVAFVHAFTFHAAINLVGWFMILGSSMGT